ncbi:MAG: hypothetical protein U0746_17880 [Gemmataceae bacterium]
MHPVVQVAHEPVEVDPVPHPFGPQDAPAGDGGTGAGIPSAGLPGPAAAGGLATGVRGMMSGIAGGCSDASPAAAATGEVVAVA